MADTQMTPELFRELLLLKNSFFLAGEGVPGEDLGALSALTDSILENREPVYLKDLAVGGTELIRAGVKPGPGVGACLQELLDRVRRDPSENVKERLLSGL